MSYDYILDFWGKFRRKKSRFEVVETKAIGLIKQFVNGSINNKDFASSFEEVRIEFLKLMEVNGQITFDEDTPLWLNTFIGAHFIDWHKYQCIKKYFEEHPEELVSKTKENFERIQGQGYEERFQDACKAVLKGVKI